MGGRREVRQMWVGGETDVVGRREVRQMWLGGGR